MGRRKIEIQPITHERNRSVTFLKRKNGLFKKAYELAVLCSIDVAVIIFEEKPGHHVKLYEYCSSDVNDIVNRRVRHEGEKDSLGPAHFSGNASKTEDMGDVDDDDNDDDEDIHRGTKRRIDGTRVKASDLQDLYPPRSLGLHGLPPNSNTSSIPVSSDRHSVLRGGGGLSSLHHRHVSNNSSANRKPRMAGGISISTHNRSSSDDHGAEPVSASSGGGSAGGVGGYGGYTSSPTTATTGYRQGTGGGGQYNSVFPLPSSTPNLIAPTYDFRAGGGGGGQPTTSPQTSYRGSGGGGNSGSSTMSGYNNHSRGTGSTYDTGMYSQMTTRQMSHTPSAGGNSTNGGGAGTTTASGTGTDAGGGSDIFSFLHDESHRPTPGSNSGAGYSSASIDWPTGTPTVPPASSASQSGSTNDHWMDFLSSNPTGGGGGGNHSASGGRRSTSDAMSWERGGQHGHDRTAGNGRRPSRMGSHSGGEENDDYTSGAGGGRSNGIGGRKDLEIKKEKDVG